MSTPKLSRLPVILFVLAVTFYAAAPARAEEWYKAFDVTGRPNVRIETNDGGVRVLTGAGYKQVTVRVEYSGYQLDRDFTIDSHQTGNRVDVNARLRDRWCVFCVSGRNSFRIEVHIPTDSDLQIETGDGGVDLEAINGNVDIHTGDGHIRVDGAKGAIRLRTGDGSIEAFRLDGQFDATSGDGRIRAEGRFDRVNVKTGDGPVDVRALAGSKLVSGWSIHSGDGSVSLTVPDNLQADINAHTNDGRVDVGIPLQTERRNGKNSVRGRLNGGGELLNITTGDGSIRLNR